MFLFDMLCCSLCLGTGFFNIDVPPGTIKPLKYLDSFTIYFQL